MHLNGKEGGKVNHGVGGVMKTLSLTLTPTLARPTPRLFGRVQVKKLPRSVTVGALRLLCEKLFKV